jgi:hypothetical protein
VGAVSREEEKIEVPNFKGIEFPRVNAPGHLESKLHDKILEINHPYMNINHLVAGEIQRR